MQFLQLVVLENDATHEYFDNKLLRSTPYFVGFNSSTQTPLYTPVRTNLLPSLSFVVSGVQFRPAYNEKGVSLLLVNNYLFMSDRNLPSQSSYTVGIYTICDGITASTILSSISVYIFPFNNAPPHLHSL